MSAAAETRRPSVKKIRLQTVNSVKREEINLGLFSNQGRPIVGSASMTNRIIAPKVIEQNQNNMTNTSKVPQS